MSRIKTISDQAVLDAAIKVMFGAGPADLTLAAVAAEAGISPATLLQRFGDKRRLIVAAIAQDNDRFAATLAALPETTGAAAVIAVFRVLTPDVNDADALADQLIWRGQNMRDADLNALARTRFALLRQAVARRLPPLAMAPNDAARLVEAQWQGALNQWGISREGSLVDYVTRSLAAWFSLVRRS
jgi:AcrR family transcriptional regulator